MSTYSIKDLENLTGVKAHTIRIWEQRYGIVSPVRTDTNVRLYSSDELKNMLNITLLNNNGYKISKIAEMTFDERRERVQELLQKHYNNEDQIAGLTMAMIDLDEERFEKFISLNVMHSGFESVMINIIYPFLHRVGALWQTSAINPAQEHFITSLIRQKLIVAIDGLMPPHLPRQEKFVLFLPEGELHEISLLFAYYLVKSRGHKVIYLGQSLPMEDLIEVQRIHNAKYLFTVMTSFPPFHEVQGYVNELARLFPQATLLVTGYQVLGQGIDLMPNTHLVPHFNHLTQLLQELSGR